MSRYVSNDCTVQELGVTVISQEQCQRQWSYGRGRVEVVGVPRAVNEHSRSRVDSFSVQ